MQSFIGDNTAELRWEPLKKRNRLRVKSKFDLHSYINDAHNHEHAMNQERIIERRGGHYESYRLGFVFWEIGEKLKNRNNI